MSRVIKVKSVASALMLCFSIYVSFSIQVFAQNTQDKIESLNAQANSSTDVSPLNELGSEYHNGIKLLQNRFRIDYKVDEITMVFFREFGSEPIVLVRPDGSKIFQTSADDENIFWFDNSTYDMISLKNPTPGPWQAVGQVSPQSRVMVLSDLALHVDPLPNIVFSGEILKQTAYLTNGGKPINYTEFRDVVELTISLSSTNNPNYNNFGAHVETVAFFEDNGKGMDERPLDGIFTGQFNLAVSDGEWIPTFTVATPMFSREQVDPNIMLLSNPIKVDVEVDGAGDGYHKLKVDAQREYVDMSTLLIDGKVRFPNGEVQNFSITDMSSEIREHLIGNNEYGVYRVKLTAYGNTVEGREFILNVPEYSFLTEEPEPIVIPIESDLAASEQSAQMQEAVLTEDEMSTTTLISLIVGINLFILILGGGLIWWLSLDKQQKSTLKKKLLKSSNTKEREQKLGFLAKIFKRKPQEPIKVEKPTEAKAETGPEFKDLSIPKD